MGFVAAIVGTQYYFPILQIVQVAQMIRPELLVHDQ